MTERGEAKILAAIERLERKVDRDHVLLVGNGDSNAIIPRLQALEFFVKGAKLLTPVLTGVVTAGVMYAIFGTP